MNKTVTIILIVLTCICVAACAICIASASGAFDGNNGDSRLIGRWEFESKDTGLTFYSDHTGRMASLSNEDKGANFNWSYDEDADAYAIYMEGKGNIYFATINADGNLSYNGEIGIKAE